MDCDSHIKHRTSPCHHTILEEHQSHLHPVHHPKKPPSTMED
jgi:hypothetical protein